jgi:TrmH family RNA methyltransferase
MLTITSRQNDKVKLARALHSRKTREAEQRFLVEGTFHLGEAAAAGAPLDFVLYAEEQLRGDFAPQLLADLRARGIDCHAVSGDVMDSISGKENPSGLVAVAHQDYTPLSAFIPQPSSLFIALVEPADPGNLGSILRTADAVGAGGMILLGGGVDAYHPSAVRAGLGAHFWVPLAQASFDEFTSWTKDQGIQLCGASAKGGVDYREASYPHPLALVLGSEREGLSASQRAACDQLVSLPMHGRATSLNLAVAAGVLLYAIAGSPD